MTTQQLECFIRVADKLNFTKAAQEMFLKIGRASCRERV